MNKAMTQEIPDSIKRICLSPCKDVAWAFFAFFSRFEYALKKSSRYLKPNAAKPDWVAFASFCDQKDEAVAELQKTDAWQYFILSPPMKQIRDVNKVSGLGWSKPIWKKPEDPSFKWVCECLNVVRNNFFHGGKFPMAPVLDPTRNLELLLHGISLLKFLAEQDTDVREFVYETDLG